MNVERLTAIRDYLFKGIIQNFYTDMMFDGYPDDITPEDFMNKVCEPNSGVTVCALGLFPWIFPNDFHYIRIRPRHQPVEQLCMRRIGENESAINATRDYLDLYIDDWFYLFGNNAYYGDDAYNPIAVANKITAFLENNGQVV